MRKIYYLALVALVGIAFSSCNMLGPSQPEYRLSDLQGLWLENGDTIVGHYVRFTTDQSDEANYFWGCEWTESEDVYEADLVYHGNGWFKYRLNEKELLEIHKMDYGWADIPKVYIVSILTSSNLNYYEKDQTSIKFKFTKIIEVK